ncbi:hypothetical protein Kpol_1061p18 [Vanderwaltozyma polyspora DSM 70294]|uniref:PIPK domain-containing protein n=1 Tax=Vanderwaltozyma polyspora (strain ATCC 22028 / DSM 70294 / BCRC 21397 / CBS 2163 / NBRC 10782 / NRRL Y-8283 / UCD 57-17) TaxID=436907 RepID=A7TJE4_VANPO|nr:uncharacterized protein Kpol_1061p18 [Vanderwaltozyma polyspora DSM 70294]EDO17594.1 hypothetical protein Kpol_1061p18 [Vanderwaltozyma polyspora DSM 70294]
MVPSDNFHAIDSNNNTNNNINNNQFIDIEDDLSNKIIHHHQVWASKLSTPTTNESDLQRTEDNDSSLSVSLYGQDSSDISLANDQNSKSLLRARRTITQDSLIKYIPFRANNHSQILPVSPLQLLDINEDLLLEASNSILSLPSMVNNSFTSKRNGENFNKDKDPSTHSLPVILKSRNNSNNNNNNDKRLSKNSELAISEIKKMNERLAQRKKSQRSDISNYVLKKERKMFQNKVNGKHVNFIIADNMLTGIKTAGLKAIDTKMEDKKLTITDFNIDKKFAFDYSGEENVQSFSNQYMFKFKDYSPNVFNHLRKNFGIDSKDYLISLTSKHIMNELNSPGKSGSFFYFSRDYRYIIKTVHHSEHVHLRKNLKIYYQHISDNPDTLICQFYGLHRIKLPISFENVIRNRKIYLVVMNNVFPPHLPIQKTYDLKGSTWGRITSVTKDENKDENESESSNVLKDLNWLHQKEKILFGPLKKRVFLQQLKRDISLLNTMNVMDYSLLIGIYDLDGDVETDEPVKEKLKEEAQLYYINNSNFNYFKRDEGGILASDNQDNNLSVIYYIGVIDCLTNYSIVKRLETVWRSLNHDLKVISAIPPQNYSNRFYKFIEKSIE